MPQFSRSLDVYQGFNFKKDKVTPVGFITKLTIGGTAIEFKADIKLKGYPGDPEAKDWPVVSVLNSFSWGTGTTDSMMFSGQISAGNKALIASSLLGGLTAIDVLVNFQVWEYDPLQKKYYKSFYEDADLKGLIEKSGDDLNLMVADDPSGEVTSPKNYAINLGVRPQSTAQTVNLATGVGKNVVKQWGVTEEVAAG